ncbi:MAG: DUF460 domain-containing protein [Candidatus Woesearchaeota archaeon]
MKPLILGIDPGTTSAVSLISLDGKVQFLFSKKNISFEELINVIEKNLNEGTVILCGCDKAKVPKNVERIASKFNAKIIYPQHDLTYSEKRNIFREFCSDLELNAHEFDALVSSFYVLKIIQNRLQKWIKRIPPNTDLNKFVELVFTTSKSLNQIIHELNTTIDFQNESEIKSIRVVNYNTIRKIKDRNLEEQMQALKMKYRQLKSSLKTMLNERFLFLTSKIYELNNDIDILKNLVLEILNCRTKHEIAVKDEFNLFLAPYVFKDEKIYALKDYKYVPIEAKIVERKKYIVLFDNYSEDIMKIIQQYTEERKKELTKKFN